YKDPTAVRVRWAMAFPDLYEVGMSHLGIQILYNLLNKRADVWAERVYAPWRDMAEAMRRAEDPLRTLESHTPVRDLDVLGFSLLYEMSFTNVLYMLDLAGIPLWSRERADPKWPLVLAGGPVVFNPEPIADFVDACLLGDGEEAAPRIAGIVGDWRASRGTKDELLRALLGVQGLYVPSFYDVRYHADGTVAAIEPKPGAGAPALVEKALVTDLNAVEYPSAPVVPAGRTIHDRVSIEIARGCMQGCRFCQAGYIYRPSRERNPDEVVRLATESLRNTGYEDLSVLSLSAGDHSRIEAIVSNLMRQCEPKQISLSVPSMRVGTLSRTMMEEVRRVRKTHFTMAPEAGSQRMRALINKAATPEKLADSVRNAYELGWSGVKLYFMIGLPTETDADLDGIVETGALARRVGLDYTRRPEVKVSVSTFVPKPHTPFQWAAQISMEETRRKHAYIREAARRAKLTFKHHDAETSYLEGVFARGDRRLSGLLYEAYRRGATFDGWTDHLRWDAWREAWPAAGVDPDFYVRRERAPDETLPWDHLSARVTKKWLLEEWRNALDLAMVEDCRYGPCTNCGVCDFRSIANLDAEPTLAPRQAPQLVRAPSAEPRPLWRYRLQFRKAGVARYLGHLEMADQFMRALFRAELPVAKTQGFHPHPKMSFCGALALGV
ncbi:MAG: TIGR03960 family B12-binding radical SAM protein, partial [Candidatus Methylomirabilis sp.]|nr:TIGR03960 family B12-binding radical SAM protein [Deltaproteobacteria bacterium]